METPAQITHYYEYKNDCVSSSYNPYVQDFLLNKQTTEPSKFIITAIAKMCNICEHIGNIKECPHITHHLPQQTVELTLPEHNQLNVLEEQQIVSQYAAQDHEIIPTPSSRRRKTPKDEQQVTCTICNTVLKNKKGLKMHQQIHEGIKKFLCDNCPKKFLRSNQLKSHQKVHTGERPYECEVISSLLMPLYIVLIL